jgi:cysteine/O-acetylserine efflux protein
MVDNPLLVPFLSYAVLMTFTPGPNNVSASILGLQQGYRKSLPYLLGITVGFFLIMLCGGFLTEFFTRNYAVISPYLKWTGVAYMVWLAVSLFVPSRKKGGTASRMGFVGGLVLQFLNPKTILYGITIFASFAALLTGSVAKTVISAVALTALGFTAISTWTLVGSALSRWFSNPTIHLAFNVVMVVLLGYSIFSILTH